MLMRMISYLALLGLWMSPELLLIFEQILTQYCVGIHTEVIYSETPQRRNSSKTETPQ